VFAFAGRPDAERRGKEPGYEPYRALGYGCRGNPGRNAMQLAPRGPYCRTVFFVNVPTGKLGTFFTTSALYRGPHGVRVGMATATAERLLHRRLRVACGENIVFLGTKTILTIQFVGGTERADRTVIGGHVNAFVLESRRHDAGTFDC